MRTIGQFLDTIAVKAKRQKRFDVSVVQEIFDTIEAENWSGTVTVVKVVGSDQNRTVYLATDSATALLMSYDLEGMLARLNAHLGELKMHQVRLVHRHPKAI